MNGDKLVDLLMEAATLKLMPRIGWQKRGAVPVESVAEHSFGVAFVALALADAIDDATLDLEKVLIMAILHDLAEVRLTDLPVSAKKLLPEAAKGKAEAAAITDLLTPLRTAGRLAALWQEFEDRTSPEGRLVRDADKLEMMVQCLRYEQAGHRGLDEFWLMTDGREWHCRPAAELYARLKGRRPGEIGVRQL
jgi:putative hydrolase of HD superfamily